MIHRFILDYFRRVKQNEDNDYGKDDRIVKRKKNKVTVTSFLHLIKLFLIQRESNDKKI